MNKLKIMLLSALAAVTTNIYAQYTYSPIKYKFEEKGVKADGWNEISLQVSPIKLSTTNSLNGTGYSLGYNKVFNIAKGQPLYLVAGANVQYSSSTNKINGEGGSFTYKDAKGNEEPKSYGTSVSNEVTLFDINVPVSVMYDIAVSNSVSVAPYAGIKFRTGLSGTTTSKASATGLSSEESTALALVAGNKFEEQSSSVYDNGFKRFLIGWQAGVNLYYEDYILGLSYGTYLNKIADDTTLKQGSITIGYRF